MITRRALAISFLSSPFILRGLPTSAQENQTEPLFTQLTFPPIEALDAPVPFGFSPPSDAQKRKAIEIIQNTPKGPKPIGIAQSFIDRFSTKDSESISQWPAPAAWNPLVVEFFSATSLKANNDMISWCAAFANWCIERAGRKGSGSASSQSFLHNHNFTPTSDPNVGDLAVFTCYDKSTRQSIGLGHVAFVREIPVNGHVKLLGGNQSANGHSSIISEKSFPTSPFDVRRHAGGNYILCSMRINTFVRIE